VTRSERRARFAKFRAKTLRMMRAWHWNGPVWAYEKNRCICSCWGCRRYGFPGEIEEYRKRYSGCPKDFERDEPRVMTRKQSGCYWKKKHGKPRASSNGMTLEQLRALIQEAA
jgi:hypothetical protein